MTLPTLTPCPKPDCKAPIAHWHSLDGDPQACRFVLRGKPCQHDAGRLPCFAPRRETAPLHLPDVDAVARAIYESDDYGPSWATRRDSVKDDYRRNAQAVLDLIAAHQPVWKRVEPGTLIKAGTRYRRACADGIVFEGIAGCDFLSGNGNIFIDPRTIPAPEDPRVAVVIEWYVNAEQVGVNDDDARDLLARLDMAGGEDK